MGYNKASGMEEEWCWHEVWVLQFSSTITILYSSSIGSSQFMTLGVIVLLEIDIFYLVIIILQGFEKLIHKDLCVKVSIHPFLLAYSRVDLLLLILGISLIQSTNCCCWPFTLNPSDCNKPFCPYQSQVTCIEMSPIVPPTRWLPTSSQSPYPPTSSNLSFLHWD